MGSPSTPSFPGWSTPRSPVTRSACPRASARRQKGRASNSTTSVGQPGSDGSDAGRLASADYLTGRRLLGVGRHESRDRRRIRSDGGGQREGHIRVLRTSRQGYLHSAAIEILDSSRSVLMGRKQLRATPQTKCGGSATGPRGKPRASPRAPSSTGRFVPTRRHSCRLQGRRLARSTVGLWAIVEEQESLEEGGVATPRGGMWTARSALNLTARLA
jgi:hypothetical protein